MSASGKLYYPPLVSSLLWDFDGWLVGSRASEPKEAEKRDSDWDIAVPPHRWRAVVRHLMSACNSLSMNSLGGFRVLTRRKSQEWPNPPSFNNLVLDLPLEVFVDVYPMDVGEYLAQVPENLPKGFVASSPRLGVMLTRTPLPPRESE